MGQYLPGRINIIFRPDVTLETARAAIKEIGLAESEPFGDPPATRLRVTVDAGTELAWVERITALEEVEICARTMKNTSKAPGGAPQRH